VNANILNYKKTRKQKFQTAVLMSNNLKYGCNLLRGEQKDKPVLWFFELPYLKGKA